MNVEKYIKIYQKKGHEDEKIKSHLMLHGYDGKFIDSEFKKINRDRHFTFVYIFLILGLLILWHYKPVITGLVIVENDSEEISNETIEPEEEQSKKVTNKDYQENLYKDTK